jgi:hypothetical protein
VLLRIFHYQVIKIFEDQPSVRSGIGVTWKTVTEIKGDFSDGIHLNAIAWGEVTFWQEETAGRLYIPR